ncbi:unnamed protein product [Rotaria sordida]|uniref:BTB domain-containing protein n=1 Tax=Rotaria sordida TaxID=392033 RepID=A0A815JMG0_9BILA|nr:unnamed protein product [Rotaria sordida]
MGPPKVYPRRGDITGVRAQDLQANDEFIIVEFEQVVYSEQIDIYETFNPGAVVKVLIRNGKDDSESKTIWETEAAHNEGQCKCKLSHIFNIDLFYREILTNFKDLLTNNYLYDVTFQLDNEQLISSYRNILSIQYIYFNELFTEYPLNKEEPIQIRNISYEAFYQILRFILTDTIEPILIYDICLE